MWTVTKRFCGLRRLNEALFVIYIQTARRPGNRLLFQHREKKRRRLARGRRRAHVCTVRAFAAEFIMRAGFNNNASASFSFGPFRLHRHDGVRGRHRKK